MEMVLRVARERRLVVALVVGLLLLAVTVAGVQGRERGMTVTAQFPQAKGIYVGDDVTVLGVRVGSIADIRPGRDGVEVEIQVDEGTVLPADVKAAIAAPALVTVRSIALGPAYDGGPRLESGAVIPMSRTSVPVEWDEVKRQLTRLSKALGPRGANQDGSLSRLVTSSSEFLDRSGTTVNRTISDLAEATGTLADNKGDLFATVRNLQVFITALNTSDQQIRSFNQRLDVVTAALDADRGSIARAIRGLARSFVEVQRFLRKNSGVTVRTLRELRSTTNSFAEHRQGLADILHLAPTTISNFYNILDPRVATFTGVLAAQNVYNPAQIVCSAILNLNGRAQDCATALGPLVDFLKIDAPPTGVLPPLAVPGAPGTGTDDRGGDPLDELLAELPADVLGALGLGGQGLR